MGLESSDNVFYSICSGFNYYMLTSEKHTPIWESSLETKDDRSHEIVIHAQSEEQYYITELSDVTSRNLDVVEWTRFIRNQPSYKNFIWPVDMIIRRTDKKGFPCYALVFAIRNNVSTKLTSLVDFLNSFEYQNVERDKRELLINNYLNAWINFYSLGYAYHEFTADKMFVDPVTFEVLFDFSMYLQKVESLYDKRLFANRGLIPEFNDPYFFFKNGKESEANSSYGFVASFDLASDYFSLAAMLFKIMLGIFPYEGKEMSYMPRTYVEEIVRWQETYISNPVFVFDINDQSNRLSLDAVSADIKNAWDLLPEHIRNMFHNVFQKANALRTSDELFFYSPNDWKKALSDESRDFPLVYRT